MGTYYLSILPAQSPFPFNVDALGRIMYSCNFDAIALAPVSDFEKELCKVITDASLATLGTNLFIGNLVQIPTGVGPYVNVINTSGIAPLETHDGKIYERRSAQIVVTCGPSDESIDAYKVGGDLSLSIWRALRKRNVTITA